ncbi:MAG: hypothetical protein ACLUOI_05100 [Eisenbergiella sp.]
MVYQLYDEQNRTKLLERVGLADDFRLRFLGLMGRSHLPKGEGLFLKKVGSVHTCFMFYHSGYISGQGLQGNCKGSSLAMEMRKAV